MKKHLYIFVVLILLACLISARHTNAESEWKLEVGAATADITPDLEKWQVTMNGYGDRKKAPAVGVHDRLHAKALALASVGPGGKTRRALMVSTDLCMATESLRNAVLEKISRLGYTDDNFFMTATHTHSGTAGIDTRWPVGLVMGKFNPELFAFTVDRIVEAVEKAHSKIAPAQLDVLQRDYPELVRNRRKDEYDYDSRRFVGERSSDIDPQMTVMSVERLDGSPVAVLVVLASHPTILGPENMLISADWPGTLQDTIEGRLGAGATAMFLNGAQGDQAPDYIESKDDYDWAEKYGRKVADLALDLAGDARESSKVKISAAVRRTRLPRMKIKVAWGIRLPRLLTRNIDTHAIGGVVLIDDAAFLGLPGEPLHKVGLELKRQARERGIVTPVAVGLVNNWLGYIPDRASYEEGGYEADMTLFGPEEADICVGNTIQALDEAMAEF